MFAVPVAHLMPGLDGSEIELHIRDSFHVIGFAVVGSLIFELIPAGRVGKALTAVAGAVAIGFLAETAQRTAGHFFDPNDVARDAAGAGLAVLARVLWTPGRPGFGRLFFRSIAIIAAAATLAPLTYWGWGWLSERLKAPVIMDFEGHFTELYYAEVNAEIALATSDTSDGRYARIMLGRAPRSGIRISTATHDWRKWDWLVFDAELAAGQDIVVSIHINDYDNIGHFADTDAGMLTVTAGKSTYRVSIGDVMRQAGRADDTGNIRQVAVLARSRIRGAVLSMDNLRLE